MQISGAFVPSEFFLRTRPKTLPNWQQEGALGLVKPARWRRLWPTADFSCHNLQAANMFNSCTMSAALSSSWLGYISAKKKEVEVEVEDLLDKSQLRQSFWLPSALEEFLKCACKIVDSSRSLTPAVKYWKRARQLTPSYSINVRAGSQVCNLSGGFSAIQGLPKLWQLARTKHSASPSI